MGSVYRGIYRPLVDSRSFTSSGGLRVQCRIRKQTVERRSVRKPHLTTTALHVSPRVQGSLTTYPSIRSAALLMPVPAMILPSGLHL